MWNNATLNHNFSKIIIAILLSVVDKNQVKGISKKQRYCYQTLNINIKYIEKLQNEKSKNIEECTKFNQFIHLKSEELTEADILICIYNERTNLEFYMFWQSG